MILKNDKSTDLRNSTNTQQGKHTPPLPSTSCSSYRKPVMKKTSEARKEVALHPVGERRGISQEIETTQNRRKIQYKESHTVTEDCPLRTLVHVLPKQALKCNEL